MSDQVRSDDERTLSVWLDLRLDREPVCGRLRSERGVDEEFVGWLGFVDALRRMADAQPTKGVDYR